MTREAMEAMGVKVLDQEPCNDAAKERYEDLCEYFGEAKDILKNREDFKAWLGRVKWHIHKEEELSAENDDLRDQLAMRDRFQKREPCEDAISRQAVDALIDELARAISDERCCISRGRSTATIMRDIRHLPPVTPRPEVIRCKDCKHWTNNIGNSELRDNYCNEEAHGFHYRCSGDDYCSFAERRTDDVMSVFDDFMCGEVDEDGTDTFLVMLKDKAESKVESEDEEQIKVGTKVRTIKDKDFAGEEVFPVGTIGIVEEIREDEKLPYIIRANLDFWYYSRDMFEVIED